jgi:hypothetical protein
MAKISLRQFGKMFKKKAPTPTASPAPFTRSAIPGAPGFGGPRPMTAVPGMPGYQKPVKPVEKQRSYNDLSSPDHLKAKSTEHVGYTNRQVGEARDNVVKNRYPENKTTVAEALKRLNGR